MSFKAESWLADNCDIDHLGKRFLLFSMANMANDEGTLTLKNVSCVKRIRVSERTIQRWTAELVADGWIEKTFDHAKNDGRQLSNVYRIVLPVPEASEAPKRLSVGRGGEGDTAMSPSPLTAAVTPGTTPERHPRGDSHGVTPINQTENPYGEPTNTPPSPLTGGAASTARVTSAERTALVGLQELRERLWREQQRHIDRKLGRAIKGRLRAGEAVADLWADYFEPRESDYWDPPFTDLSAAVDALRRVATRLKASDQVSEHSWCTWIAPLRAVELDLDTKVLTVAFPSRHGHDHLGQMLGAILREHARSEGLSDLILWQPHRRAT